MWSVISVLSLVVLSVVGQEFPTLPIVNISQGFVVGSTSDDGHFEFYGIPYADSTSGTNRFKAPNPPPSFQDTFIANRKDVKCVRALGVGFEGTEDCLVANIFTSSLNGTAGLPVMVWIKGREFDREHDFELSFKNFVEKDVVIVTLNFRESILGFLCLGTETAPGNAGLKDIIMGLRWIQENIARFGGDPNNVSLFGHGSGAAAVDLITISPMANGLVHKAIAQSGTAMAPWAVSRNNLEYAIQVAEALGHDITNIEQLSELFMRTSVSALMAVINDLDLTDNSLAFSPCLEKPNLEGEVPFLVKSPFETFFAREQLNIPFMTGFVDKEGTIRAEEAVEDDWLERMQTAFPDFLQPDLHFQNRAQRNQVAQEIRTFYFANETISIDDYLAYHGDTMILVSALREARMRVATSESPVYLYQFSYKGSLGEPFVGPLEVDSAAHSEELAYLFNDAAENETVAMDLAVSDILIERWTNFAKTGIPTSDTSQVEWRPFTIDNFYYIRILDDEEVTNSSTLEIELENPHPNIISFWDQIYATYFLDAEGKWEITERNDDDDDVIENSTPSVIGGEDVNIVDEFEEESVNVTTQAPEAPDNDDDDDEDDTNSAPSAVGNTFLIVSLFSFLTKFYNS